MDVKEIQALAVDHGLTLKNEISFNEMGIDYRIAFVEDVNGRKWVLRIPRREGLGEQIKKEKKILSLASKHLSISVPDWKIASHALIAYPLLESKPALTFDAETYDVTWNINQNDSAYVPTLAKVLVELHGIPKELAENAGLKIHTPESARQEVADRLERVSKEIGISTTLETRWKKWLDNHRIWPNFCTFIHGDLYAGHVLADSDGTVQGIIDWSEAHVSDPAIDFAGHIAAFGEDSLKELIAQYQAHGGQCWEGMFEHIVERNAAAPLNYAIFALDTKNDTHLQAVKAQLGLS